MPTDHNFYEILFQICSTAMMLGWVLLLVVPNWSFGKVISKTVVPLFLAVAYSILFVPEYFVRESGGYDTLQQVAELVNLSPRVLLAAWIHYLAFDLLIGHWIAEDAKERGISRIFTFIPLVCCLMFGPFGWMLYQGLAKAYSWKRA